MTDIKANVVREILLELPNHSAEIEKYMDGQFDLYNTMSYRLSHLPPSDFEGMLHPVFQEDEWMVLLLGGVLAFFCVMVLHKEIPKVSSEVPVVRLLIFCPR